MSRKLTSPKFNLQIKNENAIKRRKHLSPNHKIMLRQKFMERIKSDRYALLNNMREISTKDLQTELYDIIETDLEKILTPLIQAEKKYNVERQDFPMDISDCDNMTMEEQWIFDEYNQILESYEALLEQVDCPFCRIGCLDDSVTGEITCNTCNAVLHRTNLPLKHLERCLTEAVTAHENTCIEKSDFSIIPDCKECSVYLICSVCGYWHHVI